MTEYEMLITGVTTDVFRKEKDENIGLEPDFLASLGKQCYYVKTWFFKVNAQSNCLFLYWFAADTVANINIIKLKMLSLSVLYLLFVFQDTVIYDRLAETSKYKDITLKHLEQFATEGECNKQ